MQVPTQDPAERAIERTKAGLRARMVGGLLVVGVLVLGVGGWAATAELSGAVIASGLIVVDGNSKKVQHPHGGVVGDIRVKNGDRVTAGDIVVRLDDTQTRASLAIIVAQLMELTGRKARLAAEREGAKAISFDADQAWTTAEGRRIAQGEIRLFAAKRKMIAAQKAQLREVVGQLRQEIKGLAAQRQAKAHELQLVREELARVSGLFERQLTPVTRVLAIKREQARIAGEHGALAAQIARAKGRIAEIELQSATIDLKVRSEAQKELREVEARIGELQERRVAAQDQLKRIDIRAPRSGIVHELNIHTVGGVINAAEPLMLIVPSEDRLSIEVRVAPVDIDQIKLGQTAMLRFSAFNQRTTPELPGIVTRIAADLTLDSQTGLSHYRVRLKAEEASLAQLGALTLLPGMPVEAFIQTDSRTPLSYLFKPVTDQLARAFKEE